MDPLPEDKVNFVVRLFFNKIAAGNTKYHPILLTTTFKRVERGAQQTLKQARDPRKEQK
jgi:hypothetical protein